MNFLSFICIKKKVNRLLFKMKIITFILVINISLGFFNSHSTINANETTFKNRFPTRSHKTAKRGVSTVLNGISTVNNVASEMINQFETAKGIAQYAGGTTKDIASFGIKTTVKTAKKTYKVAKSAKNKYKELKEKKKEKKEKKLSKNQKSESVDYKIKRHIL